MNRAEDDGRGSVGPGWDGPRAMALLTAWVHHDQQTYHRLLDEAEDDPRALVGGLTYLAATALLAHAEVAGVPADQVLRMLGEITARRA